MFMLHRLIIRKLAMILLRIYSCPGVLSYLVHAGIMSLVSSLGRLADGSGS